MNALEYRYKFGLFLKKFPDLTRGVNYCQASVMLCEMFETVKALRIPPSGVV